MKKIFILPILFLTILSCSKSKNDEIVTANTTPPELIGTWKNVGYYDDIGDSNGNNFHQITDGSNIKYNADGTFYTTLNNNNNYGTYSFSNGSILTVNYSTPNNLVHSGTSKILLLTSSEMILGPVNSDLTPAEKFEKVITTPTISGKQ